MLVAVLHVAIVASLGAKLLFDRATQPRVWARAAPVDPNLPIRGRYVSLRLEAGMGEGLTFSPPRTVVDPDGRPGSVPPDRVAISLSVRDDRLVALPASGSSALYARGSQRGDTTVALLDQPLAYFIPEHVPDPSRRSVGEELWVEVTLPRRGAPRPIRLGVKKDGVLTPLDVR
jgi:hypothetical protein